MSRVQGTAKSESPDPLQRGPAGQGAGSDGDRRTRRGRARGHGLTTRRKALVELGVESWNRANSIIFYGTGGDLATNVAAITTTAPDRSPRPRRRATYNRTKGVRHLFAAVDLSRDKMYGHIKTSKTRTQFLEFCRYLRSLYPSSVRIAIVCDNYSPT